MIMEKCSASENDEDPEIPALQESAAEFGNDEECNIQRLIKSDILANYVKENNGTWCHQKWLVLCQDILEKGYFPINLEQVGLALEQEKANYWAQR